MSKKIPWILLLIVVIGTFTFIVWGAIRVNEQTIEEIEPAEEAKPAPFPILHISSELDPFIQEREFWHDGTLTMTGSGLELEEGEAGVADAVIRIRGRGNSTWRDGENKRPLRFRFEEAQSLLDLEYEATDWVLLADNFDRSLLRNYAALTFAESLGSMHFTPRRQHVQLYVNGEYMGLYLLTDERDVIPGRMELTWDADPARSGFMIELDARAPRTGEYDDTFVTVHGMHYDIRYPRRNSRRTPEHVAYVRAYLEHVSDAIRSRDFKAAMQLIDLETFIDFYLVQELFKNPDIHSLSIFMYITGEEEERRLYMGPVWDFDIAAGNKRYQPLGSNPYYLFAAVANYWYRDLMQMPEFKEAVTLRWNEIRDVQIAGMIEHLRYVALRDQTEFERNFERHPFSESASFRMPREIFAIRTWMGHVEHLLEWFEARTAWLDDYFNGRLPEHDPMWTLVEYYISESPRQIVIYNTEGTYREARVHPILLHDRTMVSLLEIVYLFDLRLHFDVLTRTYTLTREDLVISYQERTDFLTINGEELRQPAPGILEISGIVYLPIYRFIEFLGYEANWLRGGSTLVIRPSIAPIDPV